MSAYEPPTQNLAIFDPDVFSQNDEPLTIATGSKYFLKFPSAQGTENLQAINVNGVLTANSSTTLNGAVSVPNNDMFVRNIRIGYGNESRTSNVVLGISSGANNTSGDFNTFLGSNSGASNTTGSRNVFVGSFAGRLNSTGAFNTFVGQDAGNTNTIGARNTFLGYQSGINCIGNDNICIGNQTDCSGNLTNSMAIGSGVKATANNTIFLGTSSQTVQIAGPVVLNSNNNLTMSAGTGIISQPTVSGDSSTSNALRRTACSITNTSSNGSGTSALDVIDTTTGRGLFILPSANNGVLSDTNVRGDCVIGSRIENGGAITISNYNSNFRNGLRVFTTDISNCGIRLQCGQNTGGQYAELAMNYNRTTNNTTTTFNNAIDFNPTTPQLTNSSKRLLSGLGTLSFTDVSGNNSTDGSIVSRIWTDSSLVSGVGRGMFYDCGINGADHIFRVNDTNGVKSTSLAINGDLNTTYNRFYQELNPSWPNVNGFYEMAKDASPTLNPFSSGVYSVGNWTTRTNPDDNQWYSVCWSPQLKLFACVAGSGGTNRVMTSPDGITWTSRTSPSPNSIYNTVIWVRELSLFIAVGGNIGTNNITTSPDGITWTHRTTPNNIFTCVCWSPELSLLVAVARTGTNDRVMTSPDGITWTSRTSAANNSWNGVCWSAELGLFVAVAYSGTGNRVMTSPDGITWTSRTSAANNDWQRVCWSSELGLFVAVGETGTGNRVMTSTNGINWTLRTSIDNRWKDICWSPELKLFVAVSDSGTDNRVMTSPDGINWTSRTTNSNEWWGICWSAELGIFVGCGITGTNTRIMTSSLKGRPPTSSNTFNSSSNTISETGDWILQANTIYATQLDIRRSYATPLSRLEIVNDGANSSYIKSRCPSGQSVLFLNTYNGASDDEVMNLRSSNIGVRRPIQFSYLTTPNATSQLGFLTSGTLTTSLNVASQTGPVSAGSVSLGVGTWQITVLFEFKGSGNHTLTAFEYAMNTEVAFPTSAPYNVAYMYEPDTVLKTSKISKQLCLTLQLTSTITLYFLEKLTFSGSGTFDVSGVYNYVRVG